MRFFDKKRRQPPAIIIVSLVDILIVLLIFLVVTTTFKNQPTVKLTLPAAQTGTPGQAEPEAVIITLTKDPPQVFLGKRLIELSRLQAELNDLARVNPDVTVAIRSDEAAPVGPFVNVAAMVKAAGFRKPVAIHTRTGLQP
jgi:biopolymer transport protein ExbD